MLGRRPALLRYLARGVPFAALLHCASIPDPCDDPGSCAAGPPSPGSEAGADGSPAIVVPPGCDLKLAPKDSLPCISDDVAIFVSPSGDDAAKGSRAAPVKTISKALSIAGNRPRIYACTGPFPESVTITGGISLYGGLGCDWAPSDTARPQIAPPTGIAVKIQQVKDPVLIVDVDVVGSADLTKPGDSAIAMFVSGSTSLTLQNVNLTAHDGVAGSTVTTTFSNHDGSPAMKGVDAISGNGGDAVTCLCKDEATSSSGGKGFASDHTGGMSGSATPGTFAPNMGSSDDNTSCRPGKPGLDGSAGPADPKHERPGDLTATGWESGSAQPAPSGNPGQGGGGGGGVFSPVAGGGGGGCGGCGGGGGFTGTNGGSSFALLSFNSSIVVDAGTLTSGAGGAGGPGSDGQAGQAGGAGGNGAGTGTKCSGGAGGFGAGGSAGSGGAGGHSAAIAHVGGPPQSNAIPVVGKGGDGAPAGKPGTGGGGPQGVGGAEGAQGRGEPVIDLQ